MEEDIQAYLEKVEKAYESAMIMLSDMTAWTICENSSDLVAYKRHSPTGLDILKVEFFVPKSPKVVLDFLYDHIGNTYQKLNQDIILRQENFKIYSESTRIRYEVIDPHVPGVSPREVVYFGIKIEVSENVYALIETSVEHPEIPLKDNIIRADLTYCIHLCEAVHDKCHVVTVGYCDPKGSIPTGLINFGLKKRIDFYKHLKEDIISKIA
jgi:START domain